MLKKKRVIQKTIAILFALIVCIPMMMNGARTVYAAPDGYVTFDYNNGTGKTVKVPWGIDGIYPGYTMPTVEASDYPSEMSTFEGWFFLDSNGNIGTSELTDENYGVGGDTTVKAKWSTNAYEITIPAVTSVSSSDNTGKVEFTGKLASAKKLSVDVTSKNDWKLVSGSYGLGYTMDNDAFSYENDESSILNFSDAINITVNDKATIAGDFEDTLTFSMHVEDVVYTLQKGSLFNKNIPSTATAVEFTTTAMPSYITDYTDVSEAQDGSILAYMDGTTLKVSPKVSGMKIYANENCGTMFYNKTALTSIKLENFDTSKVTSMAGMFNHCSSLASLTFDTSKFVTTNVYDMNYMFAYCSKLTSLDVSKFDTSNVENMASIFNNCSSLTSLDVSNFNTEKVTNMSGMFNSCSSLTSLTFDTSKFTTDNVTNMQYMFNGCSSLTTLDVSKFDTSNVVYMSSMFDGCSSLTSLDVSNFNTEKVTSMGGMFSGCKSLTKLDVSNFNTSKVTNMFYMFNGCSGLTDLDVTGFNTSSVTNMEAMFGGCSGLTSLDLTKFNTAKVTSMKNMLNGCSNLTSIDLSSFDTSKVTSYDYMFADCKKLAEITVGNLWAKSVAFPNVGVSSAGKWYAISDGSEYQYNAIPTSKADTYITGLYNVVKFDAGEGTFDNSSTTNIYLYDITTASVTGTYKKPTSSDSNKTFIGWSTKADATEAEYKADGSDIPTNGNKTLYAVYQTAVTLQKGTDFRKNIPYSSTKAVEFTTEAMPSSVTDYTDVSEAQDGSILAYKDGTTLKVSPKVAGAKIYANEDCSEMFYDKSNLTSIKFDNFNTSYTTNMSKMFSNCSGFASLDLNGFDTSNVTDMSSMFYYCYKLTSLDVTEFNTSNVTDMSGMFYNCKLLTSLDVVKFDTSNTTDMHWMFASCEKLTSLDVTKFNTSNVIDMSGMFSGCKSLTSLDVTKFDTSNVTDMSSMFANCRELTSLDVTKLDTSKVTDMAWMFSWDTGLTSLDVTKFDTSSLTRMYQMFYYCSSLTSLDVTKFNTSNVTEMGSAFEKCSSLTSLDVTKFNTSNVTSMGSMFKDCSRLTSLDVTKFDTSKVTYMSYMFSGCSSLTSLDVTKFDTSNVTSMDNMFEKCSSLTSLNLNNFDTTNATSYNSFKLFDSCSKLAEITVGDKWVQSIPFPNVGVSSAGKWYAISDGSEYQYNAIPTSKADTYITGSYNVVKFDAGDGTFEDGSTTNANLYDINTASLVGAYKKPKSSDSTKVFAGWATTAGATVAEYKADGSDLPNSNVTLYAVFAPIVTLQNGSMFNHNIPSTATAIEFTNEAMPSTVTDYTDVSKTQDGSILAYMDGTSLKVSPKVAGAKIYANKYSSSMFSWKTSLTSIIFDNFDTSNVTNIDGMFYYCRSLTSLDLSSFDTSKVTNMRSMFWSCISLTSLTFDTSKFITSNVTDMTQMFYNCGELALLDTSKFDTSNVTSMRDMFLQCNKLTALDVSNFNTSKVTNMSGMFKFCTALESLDVTKFDTSNVTDISEMFGECNSLTEIDVSNFNTANVTNMSGMFGYCKKLTSLNVTKFDTSKVTNMSGMFESCTSLTSLDITKFNTSKVTDMSGMFYNCKLLTSLDVSNLKTSNVTNMSDMFTHCESLTSLDVTEFDTSKVTDMSGMFGNCSKLTSLDLSLFDTSKVTNMRAMFFQCRSLISVNVKNFDTSKVTNMYCMFYICPKLASLDITNFDTSNVTDMTQMFYNCGSLTSLDLSSFDTSKVTEMGHMFEENWYLEKIYVSNKFTTDALTEPNTMIFFDCESLIGGNGTKYNKSNVDATYARIDTADNPGYFTLKLTDDEQAAKDAIEDAKQEIEEGEEEVDVASISIASDTASDTDDSDMISLEKVYTSDGFYVVEEITTDESVEEFGNDELNACVTPSPNASATPASLDTVAEEENNNGVSGGAEGTLTQATPAPQSFAAVSYSLISDDDLNALISLHPTMIKFEGVSVTDEMPEYDEDMFDVKYDEESRTLTIEVVGEYADGAEGTSTEEQLLNLVYSGMFAEIDDEVKLVVEFDASVMEDEECASVMGEIESFGVVVSEDVTDASIGDDDIEMIDDSTTGASIGDDIEATPEMEIETDIEA